MRFQCFQFTSRRAADELARICHRITGDQVRVAYEGAEMYSALRWTGTEWVYI